MHMYINGVHGIWFLMCCSLYSIYDTSHRINSNRIRVMTLGTRSIPVSSTACPSWSCAHASQHGSAPVSERLRPPVEPYSRRPATTTCRVVSLGIEFWIALRWVSNWSKIWDLRFKIWDLGLPDTQLRKCILVDLFNSVSYQSGYLINIRFNIFILSKKKKKKSYL